jgi:hypothetical protein
MTRRPDFQLSPFTLIALEKLRSLQQGQHVTWAELSIVLGMNAQEEGRHFIYSARRILRHEGRCYECLPGVGVKWLTSAEAAALGPVGLQRIHNQARRTRKKILCAKYEELTPQQQNGYNTGLAMMGFLAAESQALNYQQQVQRRAVNGTMPPMPNMAAFDPLPPRQRPQA